MAACALSVAAHGIFLNPGYPVRHITDDALRTLSLFSLSPTLGVFRQDWSKCDHLHVSLQAIQQLTRIRPGDMNGQTLSPDL